MDQQVTWSGEHMWPICVGTDLQSGSNTVPEGEMEGSASCCSPERCFCAK